MFTRLALFLSLLAPGLAQACVVHFQQGPSGYQASHWGPAPANSQAGPYGMVTGRGMRPSISGPKAKEPVHFAPPRLSQLPWPLAQAVTLQVLSAKPRHDLLAATWARILALLVLLLLSVQRARESLRFGWAPHWPIRPPPVLAL